MAAVDRTRGVGTGGKRGLQSPVRASDGETVPDHAEDAVGRLCASGLPIPGGQGFAGFG